jgi:chaperone BCS1
MFDQLLYQYQVFLELSKSNPVVAGALGLWGAGLVTWALRSVPQRVFNFLYNQLTTTLSFHNVESYNYNTYNELHFQCFMKWFIEKGYGRWSRQLSMEGLIDNSMLYAAPDGVVIGMGFGSHFFFHKGRFFWVHKSRLESSGVNKEKQQFVITMLGRSHERLKELVEEFRYRPKSNEISVEYWQSREWGGRVYIQQRDLSTVILSKELKHELISTIDYFIQNEAWYRQRGMPYKLTYVFHGKPGTGKTSLIKAIASYYGRNIYSINLAQMSDASFAEAMSRVPKKSIVLVEDFDTNDTVKARAGLRFKLNENQGKNISGKLSEVPAIGPVETETHNPFDLFAGLTLSGVLNTLDGIVSLNDVIVFLTTNDLSNIDSALLRKGRVDYLIEIPYLQDEEIREYIHLMFPDAVIPDRTFHEIAGCDLQALFLEHKEDHETFIKAIPHVSSLAPLINKQIRKMAHDSK